MSLSQKDAVYKAVMAQKQPDGSFDRKQVVDELARMYRAGEFAHKTPSEVADDERLKAYCGSIISNWLRKDARLGGSEPTAPKVSRKKARPVDDEMKRLVLAKTKIAAQGLPTTQIDETIAQRQAQLDGERAAARREAVEDAEALLASIENPN